MKLFKQVLPALLVLVLFSGFAAPIGPPVWIGSMVSVTSVRGFLPYGSSATGINASLCQLKTMIESVIPTVSLIMFLMAGLVYAAGQAFGAEMKSKAQGWAMSLLVGAIIGLLLTVLAPVFLSIFGGSTYGAACT